VLALEPELVLLDEPSSGIAQRETEALGPLLLELRAELGATFLLIEHDMPLIMGISDRIYALANGRIIAEGAPETVQHDPMVIESYLGGTIDLEAIS
jgi:ABC-type branched-subunit amino acid transport system ATPase component